MRNPTLLAIAMVAAACASPSVAQDPRAAHLTTSTLDGKLWVPDGFRVEEFAKVTRVRFMTLAPDGSVFVSQPQQNQVTRLIDADGDGRAERQEVVVRDLDRPHGLAVRDGWLYIANTGAVVRVQVAADGSVSGTPERVASYSSGGGHWTRTVIFGADGGMYVAIGSTCNICIEKSPERAAVMRYDSNGSNGRVFASGLRNAVGMAVHPPTGATWVTQNERDNIAPDHQDLPPEEINILQDGANYGWPYCHSTGIPNPEYRDAGRCTNTVPPALALPAHVAPLGMTFLDGATLFPEDYRGDALVAYHGSWNRDVPVGATVVRIRVRDGKPVSAEDFIVGWQNDRGQRWGRPVDVLVMQDGSVLVSDDQSGTIYRVTR